MHRRDLLRFGAAATALAIARTARAHRGEPPPAFSVVAGVSMGAAAMRGAAIAVRADGTREYVVLGRALAAQFPTISSNDNANARFTVRIEIGEPPGGTTPYLRFANVVRSAAGTATNGAAHVATFDVDAATATTFANAVSATLHTRVPLDDGLAYAWSAADARLRLRVTNHGTRVVRLVTGGRNRFAVRARRRGADVAMNDGPDGGAPRVQRLAPGEHVDVVADLRAWLDAPGAYDVDCEYQGQLSPEADDPSRGPDSAAAVWDIAPRGAVRAVIP